ncbi:MAG: HNH endonuclease [Gammaproteobacteria bacterium]
MPTVQCHVCGLPVHRSPRGIKRSKSGLFFCSNACRGQAQRGVELTGFVCYHCRKAFRIIKNSRLGLKQFCSRACYLAHNTSIARGTIDREGYRLISINGKQVREHRHVVEQHTGRKLPRRKLVHHIDGNTLNNEISNLRVMKRGEHSREHQPLSWDIEAAKALRLKGLTYKQVGEQLGVSGHTIYCTLWARGCLEEFRPHPRP